MSIHIEELYVKEIAKTTKDKDDGVGTTHKAILENVGEEDIKVVITSNQPIKLVQGEKGLNLDILSTQKTLKTSLKMPGKK